MGQKCCCALSPQDEFRHAIVFKGSTPGCGATSAVLNMVFDHPQMLPTPSTHTQTHSMAAYSPPESSRRGKFFVVVDAVGKDDRWWSHRYLVRNQLHLACLVFVVDSAKLGSASSFAMSMANAQFAPEREQIADLDATVPLHVPFVILAAKQDYNYAVPYKRLANDVLKLSQVLSPQRCWMCVPSVATSNECRLRNILDWLIVMESIHRASHDGEDDDDEGSLESPLDGSSRGKARKKGHKKRREQYDATGRRASSSEVVRQKEVKVPPLVLARDAGVPVESTSAVVDDESAPLGSGLRNRHEHPTGMMTSLPGTAKSPKRKQSAEKGTEEKAKTSTPLAYAPSSSGAASVSSLRDAGVSGCGKVVSPLIGRGALRLVEDPEDVSERSTNTTARSHRRKWSAGSGGNGDSRANEALLTASVAEDDEEEMYPVAPAAAREKPRTSPDTTGIKKKKTIVSHRLERCTNLRDSTSSKASSSPSIGFTLPNKGGVDRGSHAEEEAKSDVSSVRSAKRGPTEATDSDDSRPHSAVNATSSNASPTPVVGEQVTNTKSLATSTNGSVGPAEERYRGHDEGTALVSPSDNKGKTYVAADNDSGASTDEDTVISRHDGGLMRDDNNDGGPAAEYSSGSKRQKKKVLSPKNSPWKRSRDRYQSLSKA